MINHTDPSLWLSAANALSDAVIICDSECKILSLNPAAEILFGKSSALAQGESLCTVAKLFDETGNTKLGCKEIVSQKRRAILRLDAPYAMENTQCYLEASVSRLTAPANHEPGYVISFHDITETKRILHQLSHDASHDPLTNLLNRREFEKRLRRFLLKACANHHGVLLYLDLDHFKLVNDCCGHDAGDELLRQLSAMLRAQVRERDTLARMGGDEFALLLECCDISHANRVAQNILNTFRDFHFYWADHLFHIGVSIGVVPLDRENLNLEQVLRWVDHACYAAKENGRNRYVLLRQEVTNDVQQQQDLRWVALLNEALEKDQFQLFKQKIMPVSGQANPGDHYEILLRLPEPDTQEPISAVHFLSAAERYDLMPAIDRWVVGTVLKWLQTHPDQQARLASCCINLSGRSIGEQRHAEHLIQMIQHAQVAPDKLCFEITETAALANSSLSTCHINALRSLGCRFALDDFGIGLASFNYLKHLPVDILKIDGSFIDQMLDNPLDHAMVRSINEVGHIMGKKTVAECVSSKQLLDGLADIGIDFAQGYHIGEPQKLDLPF